MKTRRSIIIKILIPNLVLFVLTAGILSYAAVRYRNLAEEKILSDNSFLTMEWQLLQNLKEETDRQLSQKDREIAELQGRYDRLKLRDISSPELSGLEEVLQKAKAEREDLLVRVFTAAANTDTSSKDTVATSGPPGQTAQRIGTSDMSSVILRQRIRELEMELSERRSLAVAVTATSPVVVPAAIPDHTSQFLSYLRYVSGELDGFPAPRLQDIKTRVLLRAIVNSPSIRADYPFLLDETDRFFESFAAQERLTGKKEAYADITDALLLIVGK